MSTKQEAPADVSALIKENVLLKKKISKLRKLLAVRTETICQLEDDLDRHKECFSDSDYLEVFGCDKYPNAKNEK